MKIKRGTSTMYDGVSVWRMELTDSHASGSAVLGKVLSCLFLQAPPKARVVVDQMNTLLRKRCRISFKFSYFVSYSTDQLTILVGFLSTVPD